MSCGEEKAFLTLTARAKQIPNWGQPREDSGGKMPRQVDVSDEAEEAAAGVTGAMSA